MSDPTNYPTIQVYSLKRCREIAHATEELIEAGCTRCGAAVVIDSAILPGSTAVQSDTLTIVLCAACSEEMFQP